MNRDGISSKRAESFLGYINVKGNIQQLPPPQAQPYHVRNSGDSLQQSRIACIYPGRSPTNTDKYRSHLRFSHMVDAGEVRSIHSAEVHWPHIHSGPSLESEPFQHVRPPQPGGQDLHVVWRSRDTCRTNRHYFTGSKHPARSDSSVHMAVNDSIVQTRWHI